VDGGFEEFVAARSAALLRTAYLLTGGDRFAAEDLLQAALIRVARRWGAASRAPEPYTRRVLVNLSRDRARRAARRVAEAPWDPAAAVEQDDASETVAGRDAVVRALGALPPRQREVLVLRYYADLSVAETAAATGTSQGAVKAYTSRALARMRELLSAVEVASDDRS
jgi:RNA polymerase sigma-70 factor (sigma-E family)